MLSDNIKNLRKQKGYTQEIPRARRQLRLNPISMSRKKSMSA